MNPVVSPTAREFLVIVNGRVRYRSRDKKAARLVKATFKVLHPNAKVSVFGVHRLVGQ